MGPARLVAALQARRPRRVRQQQLRRLRRERALALLVRLLLFVYAAGAAAQEWPAKTVRIIVPLPAGGSADLMPRAVAEKLSEKWGQPVIVENRPGAAGNI